MKRAGAVGAAVGAGGGPDVPKPWRASSRLVKLAGVGRVGMTERGQALGYGRGYEPTCGRTGASWSVGPLSAGWAPKNGDPAVHPDGRHCGTKDPTSDCGPCGGHSAAGISQAKGAALNAKGNGGTPAAGGWAGRAALAGHRRLFRAYPNNRHGATLWRVFRVIRIGS